MSDARRLAERKEKEFLKALALIKVLSLFSFIIFGLLLLGAAFVFYIFISASGGSWNERAAVIMITLFIGILSLSGFSGTISLRKGKKKGFFYFSIASIFLAVTLFIAAYFTWSLSHQYEPQLISVFIGMLLIFLVFTFRTQQKYLK